MIPFFALAGSIAAIDDFSPLPPLALTRSIVR
jgi:hypothetical protein